MKRCVRTVCGMCAFWGVATCDLSAEVPVEYRRPKPKSPAELLAEDARPTTASAATQPPDNPFGKPRSRPDHALPGVVVFSNGRKLPGYIWTAAGKEWRLYERASRQFRDIPFDVVKVIDGLVEWERMEDDWRWKEGGSDVKVLTGHTYPDRKTYFTFTLIDDRKLTGDIAQMFYVELAGQVSQVILHKRQEGKIGQTLDDIPYVKQVIFDAKAMRDAIEEITASRPSSRPTTNRSEKR